MIEQHWLFEATGPAGGHVTVTVRVGPQRFDRALVGHLTMGQREWAVLSEGLRRGLTAVWLRTDGTSVSDVEIADRRSPAAMDF